MAELPKAIRIVVYGREEGEVFYDRNFLEPPDIKSLQEIRQKAKRGLGLPESELDRWSEFCGVRQNDPQYFCLRKPGHDGPHTLKQITP